jgi:hypothetical protein
MTYGITTALSHLWRQHQFDTLSKRTNPEVLELCAILERTLNYAHTGSVRVIATKIMNPLWVGKALVHDGLPCFSPEVLFNHDDNFQGMRLLMSAWPDSNGGPIALASRAAQLHSYGHQHLMVSLVRQVPSVINDYLQMGCDPSAAYGIIVPDNHTADGRSVCRWHLLHFHSCLICTV